MGFKECQSHEGCRVIIAEFMKVSSNMNSLLNIWIVTEFVVLDSIPKSILNPVLGLLAIL